MRIGLVVNGNRVIEMHQLLHKPVVGQGELVQIEGVPSAQALLQKKLEKKHVPLDVTLEITLRCNLKCLHCYNFDRDDALPTHGELSKAETISLIDALVDVGTWNITFTGGESALNPHLVDFVKHAQSKACQITVKTNGSLLTEKKVRELSEAGAHHIHMSIFGDNAETHDAFTQGPGSFKKMMKAAQCVADSDMTLTLGSNVLSINVDEVGGMLEISESLNAGFVLNPSVTARHDGSDSSLAYSASLADQEKVYRQYPQLFKASRCSQPDFDMTHAPQCGCALYSCAVSATGDVYPCINAPIAAGNIREQSFQGIWESSAVLAKIRNLENKDFHSCSHCPDKPWCMRSSGDTFLATGDYLGADKTVCERTRMYRQVWEEKQSGSQELS